ncbi:hypothetical protein [Streptomyces sp. SID2119]|uniref:hypothetical protein n=1 Tax=Streptomyces sp. SID2119 TaxID=2690253 RepID=UPI001926CA76|nr:hypothetical protein [Streptomyces sp. SID2119]
MIRTTYKGRPIKILAARGNPHQRKLVINGHTVSHGFQGDDVAALDWFRLIIDKIDNNGGAGTVAMLIPGQYTEAHWYEPGTIDTNPRRHATLPGGFCMCTMCVIADPTGDKARYTPHRPDACQHCPQIRDGHNNMADSLNPHFYTDPTPTQRAGRQAFADACQPDEDDETMCDAVYHRILSGYLTRPQCLHFGDHRDARDPNFHQDQRGFTWPREAA